MIWLILPTLVNTYVIGVQLLDSPTTVYSADSDQFRDLCIWSWSSIEIVDYGKERFQEERYQKLMKPQKKECCLSSVLLLVSKNSC